MRKRMWEEKIQDMEERFTFWGSCESSLLIGEVGIKEAFSIILGNLGFCLVMTEKPLKLRKTYSSQVDPWYYFHVQYFSIHTSQCPSNTCTTYHRV